MDFLERLESVKSTLTLHEINVNIADIEVWTSDSKYIPYILYHVKDLDVEVFFKLYDNVIHLCALWSNWKLLLCMWRGYYTYDRNYAHFYLLPEIVQYSNYNTVLVSLLAMCSWLHEDDQEFEPEDLFNASKLNKKHPEVEDLCMRAYYTSKYYLSMYVDADSDSESDYDDKTIKLIENRKDFYVKEAKLAGIYEQFLTSKPCATN